MVVEHLEVLDEDGLDELRILDDQRRRVEDEDAEERLAHRVVQVLEEDADGRLEADQLPGVAEERDGLRVRHIAVLPVVEIAGEVLVDEAEDAHDEEEQVPRPAHG